MFGQVATYSAEQLDSEPWFAGADLPLPESQEDVLADRWHERCGAKGIRLRCIRADVVLTRRFNEQTRANDSKGMALTDISMRLLRHVWLECAGEEHDAVLILADKHGGRNRYHDFLPTVFGENFIRCLTESMERSRYRVANAEIRFETKSERHLPVALASMVCKYLRELSMKLFNQYWAGLDNRASGRPPVIPSTPAGSAATSRPCKSSSGLRTRCCGARDERKREEMNRQEMKRWRRTTVRFDTYDAANPVAARSSSADDSALAWSAVQSCGSTTGR